MNELAPVSPVSPLRQRLIDDMTVRHFNHETQRNYLRDVGRFATWLGRSPHTAVAEDLRRFQIEQQGAGVPAPTMNSIVAALRFFFNHTLDRPAAGCLAAVSMLRRTHDRHRDLRAPLSASRSASQHQRIREPCVVIRHGISMLIPAAAALRGTEQSAPVPRKSGLRPSAFRPSASRQPHRRPLIRPSALTSVRLSAPSAVAPVGPQAKSP